MILAPKARRESKLPSLYSGGSLLGTGVGDPAREGCSEPIGVGTVEAKDESEGGRDKLERGLGTGDNSSRILSLSDALHIFQCPESTVLESRF